MKLKYSLLVALSLPGMLAGCGPDAELSAEKDRLAAEVSNLEEKLGRAERERDALRSRADRLQKELEEQLRGAGIDVIEPSLVARAAFSELFAYGGDLTAMMNDPEMMTGGKVDKALINAQAFAEAVYERLK